MRNPAFINSHWIPFMEELQARIVETKQRTDLGYMLHQRLPSQQELEQLQQKCLALTTGWYEVGNLSALYAALIEMSQIAQITAYPYAQLPVKTSHDGYLIIFDKDTRDRLFQEYKDTVLSLDKERGGINWQGGKNVIDNSILPEVLQPLNFRRYLPLHWHRKFALQTVSATGELITIRPAGATETSLLRANEMPNQPVDGLGIATSGTPVDNTVCDIEKIARGVAILNPADHNKMLAGEIIINGGQNSVTGSSIPQTQHLHYAADAVDQFKLYMLDSKPIKIAGLGTVDLVQVSPNNRDAFFIKAVTKSITSDEYLNFFINLRLNMLREFGVNVIDFHFHIVPAKDGTFVTIMAPFAKLTKIMDPKLGAVFINPETNKDHVASRVAEHLHVANASRTWAVSFRDTAMVDLCMNDGKGQLAALYDFTAKKGTRDFVEKYYDCY